MNLLANRLWARKIVSDVLAQHVEDDSNPSAFPELLERDRDRAVGIIFDQIMADLDSLEKP